MSYTSKADQSIHTPAHLPTYRSYTTIHPPFLSCSGLNPTHTITSLQPPSPSVPKQALPVLHAHMLLQLMAPHRPAIAPLLPPSSRLHATRIASYPLHVMLMGLMALLVRRDGSTRGLVHSICRRTTRPSVLNLLRAGRAGPDRTGPDRTGPIRYLDGTRLDSTRGLTRPDRTWPPLLLLGASSTSRPRHTVAMAIRRYVSHRTSAHTATPTIEIPPSWRVAHKPSSRIDPPAHPSTLQPPSPSVLKSALRSQAPLPLLHAHVLLQLMPPHRPAVAPLLPPSSRSHPMRIVPSRCDADGTLMALPFNLS